ncbi:MAG: MBOAT family protein [Ectothiorhodospiraceae bacterium]|nr:MBOAT family protein [Ectothiorhodospiraceae bacterium]
MLFNSYEFLFAFLPLVLAGFYLLAPRAPWRITLGWLVVTSLFFYGWWNPRYLLLIGASIAFNFLLGRRLLRLRRIRGASGRSLLVLGVALNLASIAYFKYAGFMVSNVAALTGVSWSIDYIVLPLAISFFTFQQITYLVDAWRGETAEYDFVSYCLFVTFFPQLIAGPIVHHSEMMPQFARRRQPCEFSEDIAIGLFVFAVGLFKKAVLADGVARYATPIFSVAEMGTSLDLIAAWGGALAYTLQLYFDFSGYSDMAVGAARLFGVRLPLNFDSPYKARSIVDFWRRWHMTLSRFLRDYLYIPLGGGRVGRKRRYANLLVTMLLGGLWHGAGWTFIVWGGLHGSFLVVNHAWSHLRHRWLPCPPRFLDLPGRVAAHGLTFSAVVVGWVFFRASSFDGALAMLEGMAGLNGVSLPEAIALRVGPFSQLLAELGVRFHSGGGQVFLETWAWVGGLLLIALLAPNSQEIAGIHGKRKQEDEAAVPWLTARTRFVRHPSWAIATGLLLAAGTLALPQVSEFLYFQF